MEELEIPAELIPFMPTPQELARLPRTNGFVPTLKWQIGQAKVRKYNAEKKAGTWVKKEEPKKKQSKVGRSEFQNEVAVQAQKMVKSLFKRAEKMVDEGEMTIAQLATAADIFKKMSDGAATGAMSKADDMDDLVTISGKQMNKEQLTKLADEPGIGDLGVLKTIVDENSKS